MVHNRKKQKTKKTAKTTNKNKKQHLKKKLPSSLSITNKLM